MITRKVNYNDNDIISSKFSPVCTAIQSYNNTRNNTQNIIIIIEDPSEIYNKNIR